MTERQEQILAAIRAYIAEHGYPPTLREIAERVGLRSPKMVMFDLDALERERAIKRDHRKPRTIVVTIPEHAA